jgi:hypothetical protein
MNCGCSKYLGCFTPGQTIDFGLINDLGATGTFVAEVYSNGGFTSFNLIVDNGDPIELPFTFNENAETMIKIKLPALLAPSSMTPYATTPDGACCFVVSGLIPQCS